ncbi:CBS domain-containing protein [bacterium]|nr:CBS domain-containing protein [bacterium]
MPLQNILKKSITYASPGDTVRYVAEMMSDEDVGAVVIVETGMPRGIVTDRDIVLRCLAMRLDPDYTAVEEIMTTGVETVTINDGIFDVIKTMRLAEVRRVVIVDENQNAVGLLSLDDILDLLGEEMNSLRQAVAPKRPKILERVA